MFFPDAEAAEHLATKSAGRVLLFRRRLCRRCSGRQLGVILAVAALLLVPPRTDPDGQIQVFTYGSAQCSD